MPTVSPDSISPAANWHFWELGPYVVEAPLDFPPASFLAAGDDPASADAPTADKARYGVLFWDVSHRWPGINYIKFITTARSQGAGATPEVPVDPGNGQPRKHDTVDLAGLHFLRVFYFNQPHRYLVFDGNTMIEVHVDAAGAVPAEAMNILEHMAGSIRRIHTDAQIAENARANSPSPASWQLTELKSLPGGMQVMLPAGAHVEETVHGIGMYDVSVRKPDGTEIKLTVKNVVQPRQQFDQDINAGNSADGSSTVRWIDSNGLQLAKTVLKDRVTNQQCTMGFACYQNGRTFAISIQSPLFDNDASSLLEAIAQTMGKKQ